MKKSQKQRSKEYRERHPEKYKQQCKNHSKIYYEKTKEKRRISKILKTYNLTLEEYYSLYKDGAFCSICGISEYENNKKLAIDHCHKTGIVRGLLCNNCNHGLGKFKDSIQLLSKAIDYLNA